MSFQEWISQLAIISCRVQFLTKSIQYSFQVRMYMLCADIYIYESMHQVGFGPTHDEWVQSSIRELTPLGLDFGFIKSWIHENNTSYSVKKWKTSAVMRKIIKLKILTKNEIRQLWVRPIEWLKLNFASIVVHPTRSLDVYHIMVCVIKKWKTSASCEYDRSIEWLGLDYVYWL